MTIVENTSTKILASIGLVMVVLLVVSLSLTTYLSIVSLRSMNPSFVNYN